MLVSTALRYAGYPRASRDAARLAAVKDKLKLQPHIEGGYFVETDRATATLPCTLIDGEHAMRRASTSIFYLLDSESPLGAFHRNKARTVHTLHSGRGRYVIIHADEAARPSCPAGYGGMVKESERWNKKARIETFVVGHDVANGERLQWIVEGGKYKCSFLLPDVGADTSEGLLISETVVPGFEYEDHDFMSFERLKALVSSEELEAMQWMLRGGRGGVVDV